MEKQTEIEVFLIEENTSFSEESPDLFALFTGASEEVFMLEEAATVSEEAWEHLFI